MKARLALNIQTAAVRTGAEAPLGAVILFEDSDAEWLSWAELGPWRDVRSSLQQFSRVEGRWCMPVVFSISILFPPHRLMRSLILDALPLQ